MTEPTNSSGYPLGDDLRETMASALGIDVDEGWLVIATELLEQVTTGPGTPASPVVDEILKLNRPLPCLICGKELEPTLKSKNPDDEDVFGAQQPYGAVMCSTAGNYGSTVWDSLRGNERLEFNVCDECLTYCAPGRIREVHYHHLPAKVHLQRMWEPPTTETGIDDDG